MPSNLVMIVTNAGLTAAQNASQSGVGLILNAFKLGSAYNYTPDPAQTTLSGSVVYTDTIAYYSNLPDGTTVLSCVVNPQAGPFTFGEIGIYTSAGVLFAIGTFPNQQVKYTSLANGVNSTFTFNCQVKLAQASTILNLTMVTTPSSDIYLPWSGVVPAANLPDPRVKRIIITDADSNGNLPSLAQTTAGGWSVESVVQNFIPSAALVNSTTTYCDISEAAWRSVVNTSDTLATSVGKFSNTTLVVKTAGGSFRQVTASVVSGNVRLTYSTALAAAASGNIQVYSNDLTKGVTQLSSMSLQSASNVAITGGTISGITDLAVADGGTGASTPADARANLGITATGADTTYAFRANNLSDLTNASDARTNLGLAIGVNVPAPNGAGSIGTWPISVSGNAATATASTTQVVTDNSTKISTTEFVQNKVGDITGKIEWFARNSAPTGYLIANGAAVSRTTYAALFTAIGTTFGVGDGSTTFNLPDMRNRMPVGSGSNFSLGNTGGSADAIVVTHTHTATFTGNALPAHSHTLNVYPMGGGGTGGGDLNTQSTGYPTNAVSAGTPSGSVSVSTAGSSGTNANLPPYIAMLACIKF